MRFSASAPVLACKQDFPGMLLAHAGLPSLLNGRFNSGTAAHRPKGRLRQFQRQRYPRRREAHKDNPAAS